MVRPTDPEDYGASVNKWTDIIRRGQLGKTKELNKTRKLVAYTIASYANPDGTKVYPGIARLAVQCNISYSTARRTLAWLRDVGLLEVVKRGNSRAGKADEHRLIIHADILERIEVPTPTAEKAAIAKLNEQNTAAGRARQSKAKALALTQTSANQPVDNKALALTQTSANPDDERPPRRALITPISAHTAPQKPPISAHLGERPPSLKTGTHPAPAAHPPSPVDPSSSSVRSVPREAEDERRRQLRELEELMAGEAWQARPGAP